MSLIKTLKSRKIDYFEKINESFIVRSKIFPRNYINIIIPVRGRTDFYKPVTDSINKSIEFAYKVIGGHCTVTIVEHSEYPEYKKILTGKEDYIWIPAQKGEPFNKCLCMNIGAISNKGFSYFLFHDSDLIVPEDFIFKISMSGNASPNPLIMDNSVPMQCFVDRRVLYLNKKFTEEFIKGDHDYREIKFDEKFEHVKPGTKGAPGGSILLTSKLFFQIGGFEAEFFSGYSIEDQMFFDKLSLFKEPKSLNTELVHLYHEQLKRDMNGQDNHIFETWRNMDQTDKIIYCKYKADNFI